MRTLFREVNIMEDFKERAKELVSKMTLAEKIAQMQHDAPAIERLGIPAYNWWNEALHGVARSGTATVFPQTIAMAASFNEDLMYKVAEDISNEVRAKYNGYKSFGSTKIYQGLTCWAPNINIFRDPRWGRGHETYGEDPYLAGVLGTAFVKGMQGDGKYRKTDATLKHFAVHSGPEGIRHSFNSVVSEKDLRETYLWAFKYCIDNAEPAAVMGAYNRLNGEPCCGSKTLLQDILCDEWGFDGYIVSDCGAVCDFHTHHRVTEDAAESAALAVNNGCIMNCGAEYAYLIAAIARGLVSEETITKAVEKLFEARYRLGMFDDDCEYNDIPLDVIECKEHMETNLKMAQESVVLLKNDGILPLKGTEHIAVIGPNADDVSVLLGNYNGTPSRYSTILKGIQDKASGHITYAKGCDISNSNSPHIPFEEAIIAARNADVVILCMGLNTLLEGEAGDAYNADYSGDKRDLELPPCQMRLYDAVIAQGKPTVFFNVTGSCTNLSRQDKECNAVLQVFYPGAMGGEAVADILFGNVSPSGRLPVTFYESIDDLPPFEDYSMENRTYKFFKGKPVYEFGYGLTYSNITENWIDDKTVEIENKGYIDTAYSVLRYEYIPHKNLCGFKKIFLKAGEKEKYIFL